MADGRIKWYNERKGYGFIEREDGDDLFFHRNGIEDLGHFGPRKDDPVVFEVKSTPRGLQAVRVKVL